MKRIILIPVTLLVGLALANSRAVAQTAEELFQKGKQLEEVKGELEKAIEIFNRVVTEFPNEKPTAAKALLHVGVCYEKLGKSEAQKAYERVIKEYGDQREVVAEARNRLLALESASQSMKVPELKIRQVWTGLGVDIEGGISSDGRYLSFTDWSTGDLAVRDMATGEIRRLTKKGSWASTEYADFSTVSPDGKQVAYAWQEKSGNSSLRLVRIDGSEPRILYPGIGEYLRPDAWSHDGKNILTIRMGKKGTEIALISTTDSSVRVLKSFDRGWPQKTAMSPDDRWIAFDYTQDDKTQERDVFLLATDGSREIRLVEHPANDFMPVWAPDGKSILFTSDRGGAPGFWSISVLDGNAQGPPRLVKPDIGNARPFGMTSNGTLYYGLLVGGDDVYTANIDPSSGRILSVPVAVSKRFIGFNSTPACSPDGQFLAFVSARGGVMDPLAPGKRMVVVRSLKTGEERELRANFGPGFEIAWAPDSRSFMVAGRDSLALFQLLQVDAKTGESRVLVDRVWTTNVGAAAKGWFPDGKSIYLARGMPMRLVRHNLASGEQQQIFTWKSDEFDIRFATLSPDGRQFASWRRNTKAGLLGIVLIPAEGGELRELFTMKDEMLREMAGTPGGISWTPDGRYIMFARRTETNENMDLWRVSVTGEKAEKLGSLSHKVHDLVIHPDGKRIFFSTREKVWDVWVMENFLPKEEKEVSFGPTLKQLNFKGLNTPFARLSPDGMKMAYVEYVQNYPKRIHVLDLSSESDKVLVDSGAGGQFSLVWSPHSDNIAYTFRSRELRVRDIDREDSRLLLKNSEYQIYPSDWSRDEKKILCFFEGDDWTTRIGTITTGGQVQFLVSGSSSEFRSEPKFSPDGKYIACSLERAGNTDIYVWAADGSREVRVTDHPGRDDNSVWSPDGKYLVFLSDRNRSVDLWAVQMRDGATVGGPFIVWRDLGWRTRIYDFTASGKLSMLALGGAEPQNLFVVPVDQGQGNLRGAITPISLYPTDHFFPRYSPNGKMVAYLSRRGQMGWPRLFVLDENGSERELALQGHYAVNVAWHPENRSLFFAGMDKTGNAGIYERSLDKEEIRTVYSGGRVDMKTFGGALININLLPDAKKLMFFKYLGGGDAEVHTCELAGQNPAVVLPRVNMPIWGSPSPTGENICYRIGDSLMLVSVSKGTSKVIGSSTLDLEASWAPNGESFVFRERSALRIFSLKENTSRTLYQAPAGKTIGGMELYGVTWSPNGGYVIFTERDTSASSVLPQKLFLISPRDGSLKTLGEAPDGYRLSDLRWSPDGSKILATGKGTSSARAPLYEYWVMENFLPKEGKAKK